MLTIDPTSPRPTAQAGVPSQLDELRGVLSDLKAVCRELAERISPILLRSDSPADPPVQQRAEPSSTVAGCIRDLSDDLNVVRLDLQDVLNRIDV